MIKLNLFMSKLLFVGGVKNMGVGWISYWKLFIILIFWCIFYIRILLKLSVVFFGKVISILMVLMIFLLSWSKRCIRFRIVL